MAPENTPREPEDTTNAVLRWTKAMERCVSAWMAWLTVSGGTMVVLLTLYLFLGAPPGIASRTLLVAGRLVPLYTLWTIAWLACRWVDGVYFARFPWMLARFDSMRDHNWRVFGLDHRPAWPHGPWAQQRVLFFLFRSVGQRSMERTEAMKLVGWSILRTVWALLLAFSLAPIVIIHLDRLQQTMTITITPDLPFLLGLAQVTLVLAGLYWAGWSGIVRPALERRVGGSVAEALERDGYRRSFFWG